MDLTDFLRQWTPDRLRAHFGERVYARGLKYQEEHNVGAILTTEKDLLQAVVFGNRNYVVEFYRQDGQWMMVCDCPYELPCKHMVAVLLEGGLGGDAGEGEKG